DHRNSGQLIETPASPNRVVEVFAQQPATRAGTKPNNQTDRQDQYSGRPALVSRRRGARDHPGIGGIDHLLLAGFPRPREKRSVARSTCLRLALELAQSHKRFPRRDRLLLELIKTTLQQLFARERAIEIALGCRGNSR